jgi:WD40 repeat protein
LVASGDRNRIRLWDPATGENRVLGKLKGPALALCEVRVGGHVLVASAGVDRTIHFWDPTTRREVSQFSGHPAERVNALLGLPGQRLVTAGDDALVIVLDVTRGELLSAMVGSTAAIQDLCWFTVDGADRLASVGLDGVVRIWDPVSGTQLHALTGHDCWLWAVCPVNVGGRVLVASAGDDRVIRLWDPVSGALVRAMEPKLTLHTAPVFEVGGGTVFALREVRTADSTWLAVGGDFPGVWLWDADAGDAAGWVGWGGAADTDPACGWVRGLETYPSEHGPDLITCGYDKTVQRFAVHGRRGFQGF